MSLRSLLQSRIDVEDFYCRYYDSTIFNDSNGTLRQSWERLSRFEASTGVAIGAVDYKLFVWEMRALWAEIAGIALVETLNNCPYRGRFDSQEQRLSCYAAEQIFTRQYLLSKALSEMWVTMAAYNEAPISAASEERLKLNEFPRNLVVDLLTEHGIDPEIGARIGNQMFPGMTLLQACECLAAVGANRLNLDCSGLPDAALPLMGFVGQVYSGTMAELVNVRLRCPKSLDALSTRQGTPAQTEARFSVP